MKIDPVKYPKAFAIAQTMRPRNLQRMYSRHRSMLSRCLNPDSTNFKNYGGRGISITDRWLDFPNYLADMGKPPFKTAEIDRRDNDGHYSPENCRWVTPKTNSLNRRSKYMVWHRGKLISLRRFCLATKRCYIRETAFISVQDPEDFKVIRLTPLRETKYKFSHPQRRK